MMYCFRIVKDGYKMWFIDYAKEFRWQDMAEQRMKNYVKQTNWGTIKWHHDINTCDYMCLHGNMDVSNQLIVDDHYAEILKIID